MPEVAMTNFGKNRKPEANFGDAPHVSQDAYREFIGHNLAMACFEADMWFRYASAGDDFGLTYTIRRLVAHTKAAIAIHADLQASRGSL
jgi:hypothetical protein